MARERVPGDGPKCSCGQPAVWGGYCRMTDGHGYCGTNGRAPIDIGYRAEVIARSMKLEELKDVVAKGYQARLGAFTPEEETALRAAIQNEAKWRVAAMEQVQ